MLWIRLKNLTIQNYSLYLCFPIIIVHDYILCILHIYHSHNTYIIHVSHILYIHTCFAKNILSNLLSCTIFPDNSSSCTHLNKNIKPCIGLSENCLYDRTKYSKNVMLCQSKSKNSCDMSFAIFIIFLYLSPIYDKTR